MLNGVLMQTVCHSLQNENEIVQKVQQESTLIQIQTARLFLFFGSEFSFIFTFLSSPVMRGTVISVSPSLRREEETRLKESLLEEKLN